MKKRFIDDENLSIEDRIVAICKYYKIDKEAKFLILDIIDDILASQDIGIMNPN